MPCYRPDGTVAGEHVWGAWAPNAKGDGEFRVCWECATYEIRAVVRDG